MPKHRLALPALLAVFALAGSAATALASKSATRAQANAVAQAVRSSPVAAINKVPTKRYTVTKVRISTVSPAWANSALIWERRLAGSFARQSVKLA